MKQTGGRTVPFSGRENGRSDPLVVRGYRSYPVVSR